MDKFYKRIEAEKTFEEDIEVPALELPVGYKIKMRYPFMGAYVRCFIVTPNSEYSVYYDVDGSLGAVNEPYWEVLIDGDCERFLSGDENLLIKCIQDYEKEEYE